MSLRCRRFRVMSEKKCHSLRWIAYVFESTGIDCYGRILKETHWYDCFATDQRSFPPPGLKSTFGSCLSLEWLTWQRSLQRLDFIEWKFIAICVIFLVNYQETVSAHSCSDSELSFCDPRDLTVTRTTSPTLFKNLPVLHVDARTAARSSNLRSSERTYENVNCLCRAHMPGNATRTSWA